MATEHAKEQRAAKMPEPGEVEGSAEQGKSALKPGGIGTGVAFDWALSVQLVTDATFFLLGIGPGSALAGQPLPARLIAALLSVLAAAIVFTQGEALRRGRRVARIIQIVANSLLTIYGLVMIPDLFSLKIGSLSALVVEAVLLIVSPLIVWLLTRKRTRAWFATTTSAQARARHSGRWLLWMALYAVIGGLAIALASYY